MSESETIEVFNQQKVGYSTFRIQDVATVDRTADKGRTIIVLSNGYEIAVGMEVEEVLKMLGWTEDARSS